jgi:4-carboxymuconolactone decarboxylase
MEQGGNVDSLDALGWRGEDLVRSWVGRVAPTLADKAGSFVFGELYSLRELPLAYRELLIACMVAAGGTFPQGAVEHFKLALGHGLGSKELDEALALLAAYAGFPCAIAAAQALQNALEDGETQGP